MHINTPNKVIKFAPYGRRTLAPFMAALCLKTTIQKSRDIWKLQQLLER